MFILNHNPESLLVKDKYINNPFIVNFEFDPEKLILVDDVILGKKPISCLNFDKNRFLGECLGDDRFRQEYGYFDLTKSGLKELINKYEIP